MSPPVTNCFVIAHVLLLMQTTDLLSTNVGLGCSFTLWSFISVTILGHLPVTVNIIIDSITTVATLR